jgi:hypothetical protein
MTTDEGKDSQIAKAQENRVTIDTPEENSPTNAFPSRTQLA